MNLKSILPIIGITLFASAFTGSLVSAKEICFTQYGGGETCVNVDEDAKIDVDKQVSDKDGDYSDHIKSSVHTFSAEDKVYFKITVKNKGDVDLKNVELKDVLPDFLSFSKMIQGDNPDKDGSTLKWDLGELKVGESETIKFYAKVDSGDNLPVDDKVCLTNVAKAKGERKDNGDKEDDADYSNFCIELGDVLGETPSKLPKAGNGLQLAIAGIASIAGGVLIRKRIN